MERLNSLLPMAHWRSSDNADLHYHLHLCCVTKPSRMLAAAGSVLIRAASPKLAQLSGAAAQLAGAGAASYHAVYDVGNSSNIKW